MSLNLHHVANDAASVHFRPRITRTVIIVCFISTHMSLGDGRRCLTADRNSRTTFVIVARTAHGAFCGFLPSNIILKVCTMRSPGRDHLVATPASKFTPNGVRGLALK